MRRQVGGVARRAPIRVACRANRRRSWINGRCDSRIVLGHRTAMGRVSDARIVFSCDRLNRDDENRRPEWDHNDALTRNSPLRRKSFSGLRKRQPTDSSTLGRISHSAASQRQLKRGMICDAGRISMPASTPSTRDDGHCCLDGGSGSSGRGHRQQQRLPDPISAAPTIASRMKA